jgi:hypothetical protein
MSRIIKNHFAFALTLVVSILATALSISGVERTIGLHEMLGRIGSVELFVFGLIFTGVSTLLTTRYLHKGGLLQSKLNEQHMGSVGLFYLPIIFILFLNYNKDGAGGLGEIYSLTILYSLVVLVTTNFITLKYNEQTNNRTGEEI